MSLGSGVIDGHVASLALLQFLGTSVPRTSLAAICRPAVNKTMQHLPWRNRCVVKLHCEHEGVNGTGKLNRGEHRADKGLVCRQRGEGYQV
jgi:hypothetical protein